MSLKFIVNGQSILPPVEWQGITIKATFANSNVQPTIESETFNFVNEAAQLINQSIEDGLNGGVGITEGLPLIIQEDDFGQSIETFDGCLDLMKFQKITGVELQCKIRERQGLTQVNDRLEGISIPYLISIGVIKNSDYNEIDWIIEKPFDPVQIAVLSLSIYMLQKEVAEAALRVSNQAATVAGYISGSISGSVGAAVYAALILVAEIAYTTFMIIQIINMVEEVIGFIYQPVKQRKVISLQRLLERISEYLGYDFDTSIPELSNYYYTPNNLNGQPAAGDFGYLASEIVGLVNDMFYARLVVEDSVLNIRPVRDEFYLRQSSYEMPSKLVEGFRYNTEDIKTGYLLQFETDISDEFTVENFAGTSFSSTIVPKKVNNPEFNLVKGFDESTYPVALGNRKDSLNLTENFLLSFAQVADGILKIFGKRTKFAKNIKTRVGIFKISSNEFDRPKLLNLSGGKMLSNHRDTLSAKYLWDNYVNKKSPIHGNQFKIFEGVEIPFNLLDFIKLQKINKFIDAEGNDAEMDDIDWNMFADVATISYKVPFNYTNNLTEITNEAS